MYKIPDDKRNTIEVSIVLPVSAALGNDLWLPYKLNSFSSQFGFYNN